MKLALSKFLAREIAKRARVWPGLGFDTRNNERVFNPGWPSALLATNRKERNEVKLELTWNGNGKE